jgi:sulfite exporter TauE/SafE
LILKALGLGFSTGLFCLGYCYPVLAPLMLSRDEPSVTRSAASLGLFLGGRAAAYLLFGAAVGVLGRLVTATPLFQTRILPLLFFLLGTLLVLYGIFRSFPRWRLCRAAGAHLEHRGYLLLAGFLAGLNLCPPFLLALSFALSLGNIGECVLFFLVFFIATTVYLLPFLFTSLLARIELVRQAARLSAIVSGGWFVFLALRQWLAVSG